MTLEISDEVLGRLRAIKAAAYSHKSIQEMIGARDQVLSRYSPSFQSGAIANLEEDVLRSFLYFENNCHWTGLNRQVNRICADMPRTRLALADLVELHATWELSTAGRAVSLGKNKRGGDVTDSGKPVGFAWTTARSPDSSERGRLWADGDFDTEGPRCFRS
jgi:hypothetical protein